MSDLVFLVGIFFVSFIAGYALISRVPALLHTPLMSMTNAISAVVVLGGMLLLATSRTPHELSLTLVAIIAASFNIVGGFFITNRMLKMFKKQPAGCVSKSKEINK